MGKYLPSLLCTVYYLVFEILECSEMSMMVYVCSLFIPVD